MIELFRSVLLGNTFGGKMKKWNSLLVAVSAFSAVALAACGDQRSEDKNNSVKAAANVAESFAAKLVSGEPAPTSDDTAPAPVPTEPKKDEVAPTADTDALPNPNPAPAPAIFGSSDKMHLVIYKSALDKEFLLSASLIDQTYAATGSGLNSRVVAFKRQGNRVFMLESTQGHVVTRDMPSTLILAEIPIVAETDDAIELDFNSGMSKVFVSSNWYVSDIEKIFGGGQYDPQANFMALSISNSFIDSVRLHNNQVEIRQLVQIGFSRGWVFAPSYEVRYYLTPYAENPAYVAKETDKTFDRVGYFEVPPVLEEKSGRSSIKISKWDISKPITYYVSANTPPEYVDAVKEGILYWNKAFGREVLRAEVAPAGITAPDPNYNLVQWVPWDSAGFAYADALMDPRTGEIKNAQIYLTSAFAFLSKARLRRFLRMYRPAEANKRQTREHHHHRHTGDEPVLAEENVYDESALIDAAHPKKRKEQPLYKGVALEFMRPARLCNYSLNEAAAASLEPLLEQNPDDAVLLRVSQDYVRLVTAHEVGHTLGLRHNFAGNLGANVTIPQRNLLFNNYVLENAVPEAKHVFGSSVMEYMHFVDDVLAGAQIKAGGDALTYDKAAIQWGYANQEMSEKGPLFCTDSHAFMGYLDCDTFDSSNSPIAHWSYESVSSVTQLPAMLVERYMAAKAPTDPRDAMPLESVALTPHSYARNAAVRLLMALLPLSQESFFLAIDRKHAVLDGLNTEELIYAQQLEHVKAQLEAMGGVEWAYFALLPAYKPYMAGLSPMTGGLAENLKKQLNTYLERKDVKSFVGLDGKTHDFSAKEVEYIKTRAGQFFEKFEGAFYAWAAVAFGAVSADLEFRVMKDIPEKGISVALQRSLESTIRSVILTKSQKTMTGTVVVDGMRPKVSIPTYAYGTLERRAMARFLSPWIVPIPNWSANARNALATQMNSEIENALGKRLANVTEGSVSSDLYYWLLEERRVASAIQSGR